VLSDRIAFEGGRYYQMLSVAPPQSAPQTLPDGWPEDCFFIGYRSFEERDPLLKPMAKHMLSSVNRRLKTQRAEKLIRQAAQLEQILNHLEKRQ
jgi:hypothetical protein